MSTQQKQQPLRKKQTTLTWKEPVRRRPLRWALRAHAHPASRSPNLSMGSVLLAYATLFVFGGAISTLSGGLLSAVELLLLSLAGGATAWLVSLLPRLFSSAQITLDSGQIIRECGGSKQIWSHVEVDDMQILETYRNGERRELFCFRDHQGRRETILLPWDLDSTTVKEVLGGTLNRSSSGGRLSGNQRRKLSVADFLPGSSSNTS